MAKAVRAFPGETFESVRSWPLPKLLAAIRAAEQLERIEAKVTKKADRPRRTFDSKPVQVNELTDEQGLALAASLGIKRKKRPDGWRQATR